MPIAPRSSGRTTHSRPSPSSRRIRPTKTSIVFAMRNLPGALFKAMSAFALRDIDLTKIESRPLVGKVWEYYFYVDFAASTADPAVQWALDNLRAYASLLRVLVSYSRHKLVVES